MITRTITLNEINDFIIAELENIFVKKQTFKKQTFKKQKKTKKKQKNKKQKQEKSIKINKNLHKYIFIDFYCFCLNFFAKHTRGF